MLPIREARDPELPPEDRRRAVVVYLLLITNIVVFLLQQAMVRGGDVTFPYQWGLVPRLLSVAPARGAPAIVTYMFLHGGWLHLLSNMWFLWFFGRSVEDAIGHGRFLALYALGGAVAATAHFLSDPTSTLPLMGASGAIGAVLAAYVSLFPWRRIVTVIPIVVVPILVPIPAFVFVIEWFAINLLRGIGSLYGYSTTVGIAWWAHIGGFLSGLFLVRALFPRHPPPRKQLGPRVIVRGESGERWSTTSTGVD